MGCSCVYKKYTSNYSFKMYTVNRIVKPYIKLDLGELFIERCARSGKNFLFF